MTGFVAFGDLYRASAEKLEELAEWRRRSGVSIEALDDAGNACEDLADQFRAMEIELRLQTALARDARALVLARVGAGEGAYWTAAHVDVAADELLDELVLGLDHGLDLYELPSAVHPTRSPAAHALVLEAAS